MQQSHDLRLVLPWHLQKRGKQRDDALQTFSGSLQPFRQLPDPQHAHPLHTSSCNCPACQPSRCTAFRANEGPCNA